MRIARADDPAPPGSVLFGVPVGQACLVGCVASPADFESILLSRLPAGNCLDP